MTHGEVTCTRNGQTFTGHFETVGHDDVKAVSLRFGNRSISAALGYDDPERVALLLLGAAAKGLPVSESSTPH